MQHVQLSFLNGDKKQTLVRGVDPAQCRISRYNARKIHSSEDIQRLAERMARNGFELTRALWVYVADDGKYEVFAGGTRLKAAGQAGVNVDVVVHEGYSWEEISGLSDQDNENDEYHTPVSVVDLWSEYARLSQDEGWTQQQIADAKGVNQAQVSRRVKWHNAMPGAIKDAICGGILSEYHLEQVSRNYAVPHNLQSWANWDQWRLEVLRSAIEKPIPSSRLKDRWDKRKKAVERANEIVEMLPAGISDEYLFDKKEGIQRLGVDWRSEFAELLRERGARTIGEVNAAFTELADRMETSRQRKEDYDAALEHREQAVREEERKIAAFHEQCSILKGDVLGQLKTLDDGSVDVIITSPPYNLGVERWPMGGQEQAPRQPRTQGIGYQDAIPEDEYQSWQLEVFQELYRVASEGASFFYNHKVRQVEGEMIHPMDWLRDKRNPWIVRQEIIWDRGSTHNHTSALFWPQDERIYWMTKGAPVLSEKGVKLSSVLSFHGPVAGTWHPAPFSEQLPESLLSVVEREGITVLDPFAGSCTTVKVALARGHKAIGIELSNEYIKQAIEENEWPLAT